HPAIGYRASPSFPTRRSSDLSAWAATRCKGSYYGALYRRLKARRGPKRAIVAVAHAMLHAIWHMLSRTTPHRDLGDQYFDQLNRDRKSTRLNSSHVSISYAVF